MEFFGIVEKLNPAHKPGLYGKVVQKDNSLIKIASSVLNSDLLMSLGENPDPIHFMRPYPKYPKSLVFENASFLNDYTFGLNKDLFYGLFDNFIASENALRNLLKSGGGSKLIIVGRDDIPKEKHFGGKYAVFSKGIYSTHPKDENLLIPLNDFDNVVKSLILEETIISYESLGAKSILIVEKTIEGGNAGLSYNGIGGKVSGEKGQQVLREKKYGSGTFDPERALKNKLFIHDFPNIISTINGRIHGNQLRERFAEEMNYSIGLELDIISMFGISLGANSKKVWEIDVEFYDKNSIKKASDVENIEYFIENEEYKYYALIGLIRIQKPYSTEKIIAFENLLKNIRVSDEKKVFFNSLIYSEKANLPDFSRLKGSEYALQICDVLAEFGKKGEVLSEEVYLYIVRVCLSMGLSTSELCIKLGFHYFEIKRRLQNLANESGEILICVFNSKKYKAQFYKNNRLFFFNSSNQLLGKGTYSEGGSVISKDDGPIVRGEDVITNLKKLFPD